MSTFPVTITPVRRPVISISLLATLCGCGRPAEPILDCSAQEIRHILRIHTAPSAVDDLAFTPPHVGNAEITDAGYILRFKVAPQGYQLLFRINRFTSDGTRELIDDSGKTISGHGGFDQIECKPYQGKPL